MSEVDSGNILGLRISIFIFWKEIFKAEHIENHHYSYDEVMCQIVEIFLYGIANV